jgi:hypothetical protein
MYYHAHTEIMDTLCVPFAPSKKSAQHFKCQMIYLTEPFGRYAQVFAESIRKQC